jgi:hypothetical protein
MALTEKERAELNLDHLQEHEFDGLDYCGRCNGVFPTYDMFYEHRVAAGDYDPNADEFEDWERIEPGQSLPEDAVVGRAEPCGDTE